MSVHTAQQLLPAGSGQTLLPVTFSLFLISLPKRRAPNNLARSCWVATELLFPRADGLDVLLPRVTDHTSLWAVFVFGWLATNFLRGQEKFVFLKIRKVRIQPSLLSETGGLRTFATFLTTL